MNIEHPLGEPSELAALYAAGAMPFDQLRQYESHVAAGCEQCSGEMQQLEGVVQELLEAVEPEPVDPQVREALLAQVSGGEPQDLSGEQPNPQVWRRWQSNRMLEDLFIRRGDEEGWENTGIEGIDVRRLFVDQERDQMTALVRMAAGTSYPRHIHNGPEECYVLQGDLWVGDEVMHAGDYQRAAPGSRHGIQRTEEGCLLLIVSSLSDEIE